MFGFKPGRTFRGDTNYSRLIIFWHRYVLIAFSEIFASITGLEYAFTKAPRNMRSLVMAVYLFMTAIASALGEAFVCECYIEYGATHCLNIISALYRPPLSLELWNNGSTCICRRHHLLAQRVQARCPGRSTE